METIPTNLQKEVLSETEFLGVHSSGRFVCGIDPCRFHSTIPRAYIPRIDDVEELSLSFHISGVKCHAPRAARVFR